MPLPHLTPLSQPDALRFRDVCRAADYRDARLDEILGTSIPPPLHHQHSQLIASLAAGESAFSVLARLFFLGFAVERRQADEALPSAFLESCVNCGLLTIDGDRFQPLALVVPVDDLLMAADLHLTVSRDDGHYVATISDPAQHLSRMAMRAPVERALDLCGGFGLHGVIAGQFSDQVITSDLNPRAKEFVDFNAALNDCSNLTAVSGDLFCPVKGQTFNLILSNPPFVISPETVATFRDSPYQLDGFTRQMILEAPEYLNEGGNLQTIFEWVELEGQNWQDRLREWVQGSGCDAWVLTANCQKPATYARSRLRETTADERELEKRQSHWEQSFRQHNVRAIHGGFLFLRRRQGNNWFDVTEITRPIEQPIGTAVARGFASRDLLFADQPDQALLAARLAIAPGLRKISDASWNGDHWENQTITLRLDEGLPVSICVDQVIEQLIITFDGERPVAQILDSFADKIGLSAETAQTQGLPMVRAMLHNGVLVIAPEAGPVDDSRINASSIA
ncbi:methyltransferase [Stieleria sp. TO1_6]|uniref:methyltransferase n=1 Tax=Stieleria tagensis TaxID=2956795 RepID=UPI00209BA7CF|nr:methyltransferase [Stieleria tagensis]MCO8121544.1 methyltransferase [Stieleria tagensis]